MKIRISGLVGVALTLNLIYPAKADFVWDEYTDHSDALLRIVEAAQLKPDKTFSDGGHALYLKSAKYIGPLAAPFGTVHVADLFYIRSAVRGSKRSPRGHHYIVFLDDDFRIRNWWLVDEFDETLRVDGAKLLSDNKDLVDRPPVVMDYKAIPRNGTILYAGKVLAVPHW